MSEILTFWRVFWQFVPDTPIPCRSRSACWELKGHSSSGNSTCREGRAWRSYRWGLPLGGWLPFECASLWKAANECIRHPRRKPSCGGTCTQLFYIFPFVESSFSKSTRMAIHSLMGSWIHSCIASSDGATSPRHVVVGKGIWQVFPSNIQVRFLGQICIWMLDLNVVISAVIISGGWRNSGDAQVNVAHFGSYTDNTWYLLHLGPFPSG